jgi:hypothetical protein
LNIDTTCYKICNVFLPSSNTTDPRRNTISKILALGLVAFTMSFGSPIYSHGHNDGYNDLDYPRGGYRRYHGYGRGDVWRGGYWGAPWYGPEVIITAPYGDYYPSPVFVPVPVPVVPVPSCSIIQRCYSNGTCTDFEVCG